MATPTPAVLAARAAADAKKSKGKGQTAFEQGRKAGRMEGEDAVRNEVLTFLQDKYLGPDAPDRGTPEAKAILILAGEIAEELRKKLKR